MIGLRPECMDCKHLLPPTVEQSTRCCKAFPEGIPDEVLIGGMEHHDALPGDHGIQFEPSNEDGDKAHDCGPGYHSHPDYMGGKCHPDNQRHRHGGTGARPKIPPTETIAPEHRDIVRSLINERANIGRPGKYIRKMGQLGEQVARAVMKEYDAHDRWDAANDMSNDELIEIKLLSPASQGTPIMPNAHRRKCELKKQTGKPWKFVFLRPTEDSLEMFELDEPDDFAHQPDEAYVLRIEHFRKVGIFDDAGQFRRLA